MVNCPGRRPGVVDAIQPSLYMARLPNTSKYWDVWRVGALLSLSVYSRLVPSSGSCSTPSTSFGGVMPARSEEHTSELQSLMRISYAVFCLKTTTPHYHSTT